MADYTTTTNMPAQFTGTRLVPRTGAVGRLASNNAVRVRVLAGVKYDIVVAHKSCSQTQHDAFMTFYNTNRAATFTFTVAEDGVTRTCVFAPDRPWEVESLGHRYNITVYLRQV